MRPNWNSGSTNNWGRSPTAMPQFGSYAPSGNPSSDALGWCWPWGVTIGVAANQTLQGYRWHSPFIISETSTVTAIRLIVAATAQASSIVRAGIYGANSYWEPSSLVADFGTIDSSTTGNKDITGLLQVLIPGRYWACIEGNNNNTSITAYRPTIGVGINTSNYNSLYLGNGNSAAAFPSTTSLGAGTTSGFSNGNAALFLMQLKAGT